MISTKRVANAVSGRTARACDSCIKKRARWYCAADDAFLCQVCDSTVHSANPLARRHERVRLKTASFKLLSAPTTWHKGFTRKARTTRRSPKGWKWKANPVPFVPEVCADEISQHEENDEEQLLYRVPIFDPFVAELCGGANSNERNEFADVTDDHTRNRAGSVCGSKDGTDSKLRGFFPSDLDLAEFAADVESMLGKGLEDQSFAMEDLGLVVDDVKLGGVKVESAESSRESRGGGEVDHRMEIMEVDGRETFELNFDYDSPEASCGGAEDVKDEDDKVESGVMGGGGVEDEEEEKENIINGGKKKVLLSLDYEAVIGEWASRGSPWTTAHRPEIDPHQCMPDLWVVGGKGMCGGELTGLGMGPAMGDGGGREARVSRYREKRRTRLFSKKIRYEVRKLNAEKRPRMKGRFVKRVSFAAPPNTFAMP